MKTITAKELQVFILENPTLSNVEIANHFNIKERIVWANRGAIKSKITKSNKKANVININIIKPSYYFRKKEHGGLLKEPKKNPNEIKTITNTTFHHENSQNKEVIYRDEVIKKIQESSLRLGDIYGLSASEFLTEKRIENEVSKKFNFFSCEINDTVLFELYNNLAKEKFKLTVYNKLLGDVISKLPENSIAHLIADYCGQLHSYHNDIADAVKRNIVQVDGIIAITVNKRITGKENLKWYEDIIALNNTETYKGICKVENAFKIETYLDYRCEKENGGKGANMMLAIIRRVK